MDNVDVFQTRDYGLAAYLKMVGCNVTDFKVRSEGTHKKSIMFFFNGAEECRRHHIDFIGSEFQRFMAEVKCIKTLVYDYAKNDPNEK